MAARAARAAPAVTSPVHCCAASAMPPVISSNATAPFVVAFAAGSGLSAYHLDGSRNSCFTGALVERMKTHGHAEDVKQLLEQVHSTVKGNTAALDPSSPQIPCMTLSLGPRPLYLARTPSNQLVRDSEPWTTLGMILVPLIASLEEKVGVPATIPARMILLSPPPPEVQFLKSLVGVMVVAVVDVGREWGQGT